MVLYKSSSCAARQSRAKLERVWVTLSVSISHLYRYSCLYLSSLTIAIPVSNSFLQFGSRLRVFLVPWASSQLLCLKWTPSCVIPLVAI